MMRLITPQIAVVITLLFTSASLLSQSVRFAAFGDYGVDDPDELAVANLVRTNLQPHLILTTGDNNYLAPTEIDNVIGKYYSAFIGTYSGNYGNGASSNRFFPALGNHDWDSITGYGAYTNYFTLPGNERYYDYREGPVHVFVLNSDSNEPDGTTSTSAQALWLSNRMHQSTAPWKVLTMHHPPFSSYDATPSMRWPFAEWGAALVLAGHAHHYERLTNVITYVTTGAGGAPLYGFGLTEPGSMSRYANGHGALLVTATETELTGEFWATENGGKLIDHFTLSRLPRLAISRVGSSVQVSWSTNNAYGYRLHVNQSLSSGTWALVTAQPAEAGGIKTVTLPIQEGTQQFFRLHQ